MFSLAHVILPFSDIPPADAIRASLSRFQSGLRGDVPDEWLAFADETDALRQAHETRFTFTGKGKHGLQIEGGHAAPTSSWRQPCSRTRRPAGIRPAPERWSCRRAWRRTIRDGWTRGRSRDPCGLLPGSAYDHWVAGVAYHH